MKQWISYLLLIVAANTGYSQDTTHKFLRLYSDNDAFVPSSNATDRGYTSGLRADVFYNTANKKNIFEWFNKLAGTGRITTKGWGLMQVIFAPQRTSLVIPDKNDYPYSGALFGIHTIHSANETKKINLRSEWIVGLMGPPSFGKQTHRFFHRLIKDPAPMGWDHQLPTDLLINYNLQIEKLLAGNKRFGLIGSGKIHSGTMNDGLSTGLQLQTGNAENYFSGLTKQYFPGKKINFLLWIKISADLVFYNALLEGGLFNKKSPVNNKNSPLGTDREIQHLTGSGEFFFLVSLKKFALSFQLKHVSPELKNYESHDFGNISFFLLMN